MLKGVRRRQLRRQAQAMAARREWAEASVLYRQVTALGFARASDHTRLARALDETGDKAGAEAAYRRATAEFPTIYNTHRQLGLFLWTRGRLNLATSAFLRALALEPEDAILKQDIVRLGVAPQSLLDRTLEAFLASEVPTRRQERMTWLSLRRQRAARAAFNRRDWPRTVALAQRLVNTASAAAPDVLRLALAYKESGNLAMSLAMHWRVAAMRPRDPETYLHLGHCLKMLEKPDAALSAYLIAWRLQPGRRDVEIELLSQGWTPSALDQLSLLQASRKGERPFDIGRFADVGMGAGAPPNRPPAQIAILGDLMFDMTRNG